jgi:hypothetical protein
MFVQSSVSPWAKPPAALGQAGGGRSNFGIQYQPDKASVVDCLKMAGVSSDFLTALDGLKDKYIAEIVDELKDDRPTQPAISIKLKTNVEKAFFWLKEMQEPNIDPYLTPMQRLEALT